MTEDLLRYYNRELAYVRRLGGEFAEANPKIAERLRLSADAIEDPHVARLIEAFAFLNAQIRQKLDDDFPELIDGLMGVLYPHYQAPIPSMAIARFECDPDLTSRYVIPAGAAIETDPAPEEPCRFRTSYPVTLWPIRLQSVGLYGRPFAAPPISAESRAAAVLRIVLRSAADPMTFARLAPRSFRFFLRVPAPQSYALYELLFNNVVEVALANSPDDRKPVCLGADRIRAVGFEMDEGLLPYPSRSALGYRVLTEFFVFPAKFLFFEIDGLEARDFTQVGNQLEIYIYLDRADSELQKQVMDDSLAIGCTPIVNLYTQRAEPIPVTHRDAEYRVVPDERRPRSTEIYSIDRVVLTSADRTESECIPFYSVKHGTGGAAKSIYWHASRRDAGPANPGTEIYLTLVDPEFRSASAADGVLDVEATCLNRDLPNRLPFGGGQPRLQLSEGAAPVTRIECVTPPTRTLRPALGRGALWRFVSHLILNHLSIGGGGGVDALKEILRLYDFQDSPTTRSLIDGVVGVESRRTARRIVVEGRSAPCNGTEVEIQLDEQALRKGGLFLFACVLERFLPLYGSINSFTQLVATVKGREGIFKRWPPRAGDRPLV